MVTFFSLFQLTSLFISLWTVLNFLLNFLGSWIYLQSVLYALLILSNILLWHIFYIWKLFRSEKKDIFCFSWHTLYLVFWKSILWSRVFSIRFDHFWLTKRVTDSFETDHSRSSKPKGQEKYWYNQGSKIIYF